MKVHSGEITLTVFEGRTGGVSGTVHGPKKQRITNHGYKNFTFPNHENQHVKHFYLVSV